MDRRSFLINSLMASGQLTIATTAIYSASIVGSSGPFGSMAAGAKCVRNWTPAGGCPPQSMTIAEGQQFTFGIFVPCESTTCADASSYTIYDETCTCNSGVLSCSRGSTVRCR